jgi:hypothetical protein
MTSTTEDPAGTRDRLELMLRNELRFTAAVEASRRHFNRRTRAGEVLGASDVQPFLERNYPDVDAGEAIRELRAALRRRYGA